MRNTIAIVLLLASIASAHTLESWTVDTDKAVPRPLVIRRGETRDLRVTFKTYSQIAAIPTNASVELWYRSADMSNGLFYVATGSVHSATAGVARVLWTAANCGAATNYTWDLVVLTNTTPYNLRAFGTIHLQAGVYSQATTATNPATYLALDWARIINVHTSSAPFMTVEGVVTNGGATIDGQAISNGAVIVTSGGGGGVSGATVSNIVGGIMATGSCATAATVTGAQSNIIAAALTNAADFATAAQGVSATNAQARVAVLETNAVLKADTNGWETGSHTGLASLAQGIAATNAQARVAVLETNTVSKAETNGWTVSSHSGLATNAGGAGAGYFAMSNGAWTAFNAGISQTQQLYVANAGTASVAYAAWVAMTATNAKALLQENHAASASLRGGTAFVDRVTSGLTGAQVTIVDATPSWTGPAEGTVFYQNPNYPNSYTNSPRTWGLQVGTDPVTPWSLDSLNGAGVPNGAQSFSSVLRESDFTNFPCRVYAKGGIAGGQATFVQNGTNSFKLAYWEDVRTAFDPVGSGASAALDVQTNVNAQLAGYVPTNDARYLAALTNESDTLSTVLSRGNNASSQSAILAAVMGTGWEITNSGVMALGSGMSSSNIHSTAAGSRQAGANTGSMSIGIGSGGSQQNVQNAGSCVIGIGADGAQQNGIIVSGAAATNNGAGAIQLFDLAAGQIALTTSTGDGSILLGAGTASNRYAIVSGDGQESHGDGSITAGGGFFGSGSGLTNITAAQVGAVSNGQTSVSLNTVPPPNGFETQTNQTVSFDPSTRQATVAPVGASFRVTTGGSTYTYSGAVTSSAGPNVAGGLYAYFRPSDGAFVCTNVPWTISDGEAQAIFAYLDTNAPASTVLTIDERHGVGISDSDHLMRHLTVGSTWASGMTISHFGADSSTAAGANGTNTCIAITDEGVFYDEDVRHTTVANGTSGGSTNTAGVFPILWKNSAGYWQKRAGTTFPFAFSGNVPTYFTSAGVETAVAEDRYFVYWLVAYGSADGTNMFLISHPSTYTDTASAQSGATFASFSSVVGGLASVEMLVAYRLVFQFNAAGANNSPVSVKSSKLRMVDDFRNVPGGVIMAGVGAGSGSYVLTADKIAAAGGVTNYSATPFDDAITITNTSALTVTSYFGHAYSRTFTSTGTITHLFLGTNATAGNEIFMETTATGLPARVWPAGYVFAYAGAISSNAPSPTPWAQMSVQKTPLGSIVWCVTGQVWQAGTP